MRRFSKKMAGNLRIYRTLRRDFLIDNPICGVLASKCTLQSTQIHHKKGRGVNLTNVETFLACCFNCHRWIEEHPKEAKELGYSESRLKK